MNSFEGHGCIQMLPARIESTQFGKHFLFFNKRKSDLKHRIITLEKKLEKAKGWGSTHENIQNKKRLTFELEDLLRKDELCWRQRSRVIWLQEGDKNTKFFHPKASDGQKENQITKMKNGNNAWVHGEEEISKLFQLYYVDLFTSSTMPNSDYITKVVKGRITPYMVEALHIPFKAEEVHFASRQMHPLKAQGLDGLPPLFYQRYWDIVGPEITSMVL
ncbi:hypothetical protein VNO77_04993 [Canavalia gladiata]|uniref:Reverse transcriptase n=1 Tax=Canavalia gladiata TaxID=3824 RepID=A0AAN9RDS4_CANGL